MLLPDPTGASSTISRLKLSNISSSGSRTHGVRSGAKVGDRLDPYGSFTLSAHQSAIGRRFGGVITKGKWRVMIGKPGKGSIDKFTSSNVREMLTSFTEEGIKGEFPWSAEDVKGVLAKAFGSVEKGIATMSSNAKLISKRVPGWAPGRKDMPVIDPGNVPATVKMIKRGEVDHRSPHAEDLQGGLGQAIMEGIEMAGSMAKLSGV